MAGAVSATDLVKHKIHFSLGGLCFLSELSPAQQGKFKLYNVTRGKAPNVD